MLNETEKLVLDMLLAGDDDRLAILRTQLNSAMIERREMTGVGFFTDFSVPPDVARLAPRFSSMVIGDVHADFAGLEHNAGFLLFVNDGALDFLECYIVDEHFPEPATLRRAYYIRRPFPGSIGVVETDERDLEWVLRGAV